MELIFAIKLHLGENYDLTKSVHEQDLAAHAKNFEEEFLQMAGSFSDSSGALIILKVEQEDQARTIMHNDPAVINKIFSYEMNPWHVRYNGLKNLSR